MSKVKISRNTKIPLSARQSLELSALQLTQLELMGPNVDLDAFKFAVRQVIPVNLVENITDANIDRTIDGASTLDVDVLDAKRQLLRSGLLGSKQDVKIDGLWFRLRQIKKNGDKITLTFEDREIAVLRSYAQPIKTSPATSRTKITRAQFILRLIREVREFKIPISIPELRIKQPIGAATLASPDSFSAYNAIHRSLGIGVREGLTVKGAKMSVEQQKNSNTILDVVSSHLFARPIAVMAIMCAIQESSIQNLPPPTLPSAGNWISSIPGDNPVGVFQQRKTMGWPATRDVATDAEEFVKRLSALYQSNHGEQYYSLIEEVQHSGHGELYAKWRTEAERIVSAYGMPASSVLADNHSLPATAAGSGDYEFYRGVPPVQGQSGWLPENSWDCIQRLANEVDWRAFFVSGTFYYISDDDLFASAARMRVTEGKDGVDYIDGDYDENKKVGTATVYCRVGRWEAPVGSVVELYDMGTWDGKWLVTEFSRGLLDDAAEITLNKPQPILPEPISDSVNNSGANGFTFSGGTVKDAVPESKALFGGAIPRDEVGSREGIVDIAIKAYGHEQLQHYAYPKDENGDGSRDARPIPATLWSQDAHNGIDCSAFATLVYKEAGMPDPNGNNYNGEGFTGTLFAHGVTVTVPKPGDLVFYGGTTAFPDHVAVYIGNNEVVEIGSSNGILKLPVNYRNDLLAYVTYFPVDK